VEKKINQTSNFKGIGYISLQKKAEKLKKIKKNYLFRITYQF